MVLGPAGPFVSLSSENPRRISKSPRKSRGWPTRIPGGAISRLEIRVLFQAQILRGRLGGGALEGVGATERRAIALRLLPRVEAIRLVRRIDDHLAADHLLQVVLDLRHGRRGGVLLLERRVRHDHDRRRLLRVDGVVEDLLHVLLHRELQQARLLLHIRVGQQFGANLFHGTAQLLALGGAVGIGHGGESPDARDIGQSNLASPTPRRIAKREPPSPENPGTPRCDRVTPPLSRRQACVASSSPMAPPRSSGRSTSRAPASPCDGDASARTGRPSRSPLPPPTRPRPSTTSSSPRSGRRATPNKHHQPPPPLPPRPPPPSPTPRPLPPPSPCPHPRQTRPGPSSGPTPCSAASIPAGVASAF